MSRRGSNTASLRKMTRIPATTAASYYFVDIKDPDQPKIRMGRRTAALAQYFKFIRMGATQNRGSIG